MVELDKETLSQAFARFWAVLLMTMLLLEVPPRSQEKPFKQVLPVDGGLGGSGDANFIICKVGEGEGSVTPTVEAGEQGLLVAGMGVGFLKACSELGDASLPHITGSFGLAPKHMGDFFGDLALRASVVILVLPFDEGLPHATI